MSYHQTIYNLLRGYGLTEAGALGLLGNWECESNCEPGRVQGDFDSFRTISKAYVQSIEDRRLTRETFAGDKKGFGLAQWTYAPRKAELYDTWLSSPHRIDSAELQVSFAMKELQRDYPALLNKLKTAEAIHDCVEDVCKQYERPAVNNIQARYEAALNIRQEINLDGDVGNTNSGGAAGSETEQDETGGEASAAVSWPPRTVDSHCEGWPEIWLLQAVLKCRGYNVVTDGIWGTELANKVRAWQQANGLTPDGIVGPASWGKLLNADF